MTPEFRAAALAALENNARANRIRQRKKGDPGYLVSNHAELGRAIGTDTRMVTRIIGAKRPTTKIDLVDRSVFVARIRDVLDLPPPVLVSVRPDRLEPLRWIADLPDDKFEVFRAEYDRAMKRLDDR